jgi:hypothetical protein
MSILWKLLGCVSSIHLTNGAYVWTIESPGNAPVPEVAFA